jgi:hypothetical protein
MENKETSNLEDNLPMVNYIMLHRIYDLLTLIANHMVGPDSVSKMVDYHDQGFLLGPTPSYTPNVEEEKEETKQDILDFEK